MSEYNLQFAYKLSQRATDFVIPNSRVGLLISSFPNDAEY